MSCVKPQWNVFHIAEKCQKLEQAIADIDSGSYEDFMQNFPEYLRLDPATVVSHS